MNNRYYESHARHGKQPRQNSAAANDSYSARTFPSLARKRRLAFLVLRKPWHKLEVANEPTAVISRSGIALLNAYVADNWVSRLRGLFGIAGLGHSDAMVISYCSAVHSIGLKNSIDVAFVDKSGRILKCVELKPYSIAVCLKAHSVIEMNCGTARRLNFSVAQKISVDRLKPDFRCIPDTVKIHSCCQDAGAANVLACKSKNMDCRNSNE